MLHRGMAACLVFTIIEIGSVSELKAQDRSTKKGEPAMLQTIPHTAARTHACRSALATTSAFQIRRAETSDELEAVYHFRYLIYVEEMQRKQAYADHVRRRIVDPLDDGAVNLVAWSGSEVVGTCASISLGTRSSASTKDSIKWARLVKIIRVIHP